MREESRVELLKESEAVGGRMRRMSSSNALCLAKKMIGGSLSISTRLEE